jgi:hypothetical protein
LTRSAQTVGTDGIEVRNEIGAHLTTAQDDHINFCGTYSFDINASRLRPGVVVPRRGPGHRPGVRVRERWRQRGVGNRQRSAGRDDPR